MGGWERCGAHVCVHAKGDRCVVRCVSGDECAVGHWKRIAIEAKWIAELIWGGRRGDAGNDHVHRIHIWTAGQCENLAGSVCAAENGNVASLHAPIETVGAWVFGDLEEGGEGIGIGADDAGVCARDEIGERDEVCIRRERFGHRGLEFVAANVIEHFFVTAVLVERPWEKQIEGVAVYAELRGVVGVEAARFGKSLDDVRRLRESGDGFVEKIEGAVVCFAETIVGSHWILREMVPAREDEAAEAIDEGIEGAAWGVLEHLQIAGGRIEAVGPGNGRMTFVFVESEVKAVVGFVAHEDDSSVGGVAGRDVVAVGGLVRNFDDLRSGVGVGDDSVKVDDFVELPMELCGVAGACGRADDHAEENFFAIPMNRGIADIDADAVLDAAGAETGRFGEIDEAQIWQHEPEVPAASGVGGVSEMVAEDCDDGEEGVGNGAVEFVRDGWLRDENDWVGECRRRFGGGSGKEN